MSLKNTQRAALKLFSFTLLLLVSLAPGLRAQVAGTASIQGTISDPTGAVIPNAAVTIVEKSTGVKRTTKSDSSGIYVFPNIAVGTYNVTVASKGFETYVKTDNVLEVGSSISINVTMTVGAETATVEVHANSLALQTEDVAYKQTIDSAQMLEMPLNGRNMTALVNITPAAFRRTAVGGDFTGSKYSYANAECQSPSQAAWATPLCGVSTAPTTATTWPAATFPSRFPMPSPSSAYSLRLWARDKGMSRRRHG